MMGDLTINVWMILAVILAVGMIAILMFTISRGIQRYQHRMDDQDNSLEKIDGRINPVFRN
jgi:preprotein translocase subunit YajC